MVLKISTVIRELKGCFDWVHPSHFYPTTNSHRLGFGPNSPVSSPVPPAILHDRGTFYPRVHLPVIEAAPIWDVISWTSILASRLQLAPENAVIKLNVWPTVPRLKDEAWTLRLTVRLG
jgi:hypothetical protein